MIYEDPTAGSHPPERVGPLRRRRAGEGSGGAANVTERVRGGSICAGLSSLEPDRNVNTASFQRQRVGCK